MHTLIVLAIIVAITVALLFIRIKIVIKYTEDLIVYVKILFFKIKLVPKKEKKLKLSDYTHKKLDKKEKKQKAKELKKEKKKAEKAEAKKAESKEDKPGILETLGLIKNLVAAFFKYFFKYLRIDLSKINITVASEDAAKTAIMYGAISQSVAYIVEILDNTVNMKKKKDTEVSVAADFVAEKLSADIHIAFSLLVWQVLDIVFRLAVKYIKTKIKSN